MEVAVVASGDFSAPKRVRIPIPRGDAPRFLPLLVDYTNLHPALHAGSLDIQYPSVPSPCESSTKGRRHNRGTIAFARVHYRLVAVRERHFRVGNGRVESRSQSEFHSFFELSVERQAFHVASGAREVPADRYGREVVQPSWGTRPVPPLRLSHPPVHLLDLSVELFIEDLSHHVLTVPERSGGFENAPSSTDLGQSETGKAPRFADGLVLASGEIGADVGRLFASPLSHILMLLKAR